MDFVKLPNYVHVRGFAAQLPEEAVLITYMYVALQPSSKKKQSK